MSVRLAVVCARVGNLTEAARECNLVLPAASRWLRDLERALGSQLFDRHPRGLKPTALLAEYADLHPEVQVELEEQVSQQVVAAVRDGRAELGVFVSGPDLRGLDARDLRRDELVLILPPGHRLIGRTPLPFTDALDEP